MKKSRNHLGKNKFSNENEKYLHIHIYQSSLVKIQKAEVALKNGNKKIKNL